MKTRCQRRSASSISTRAGLQSLKFVSFLFVTSALAFATAGCTRAPEKPPESPLKQAKKDSRLDPQEEQDLERRHLAPPPAYGNKVVMAQDERSTPAKF